MTTTLLLFIILNILSIYIGISALYLTFLSIAYLIIKESKTKKEDEYINKFIVLVPAHNEDILIGTLCSSLDMVRYPKDKYEVVIIADNCTDRTSEICKRLGIRVLERNAPDNPGKGQALAWGLEKIDLQSNDAVLIVDADNYVDENVLNMLNNHLNKGERAIQCFNGVGNRDDSYFTQLLYVSRIIGNHLYHNSKYKLGLSSYLMGNGICFKTELLKSKKWTAFSIAEDWEYYAQLVKYGEKIAFALNAKVFHQESKGFNQATTQRLRWSSGRFKVAKTLGIKLLLDGLKSNNWRLVDAAAPLLLPNYSLLVNLTLFGLFTSLFLNRCLLVNHLNISFIFCLAAEFIIFMIGAFIAGKPLKIFKALLFVPVFLVWKLFIDIVCFTNIYRTKKWIRTERHKSKWGI